MSDEPPHCLQTDFFQCTWQFPAMPSADGRFSPHSLECCSARGAFCASSTARKVLPLRWGMFYDGAAKANPIFSFFRRPAHKLFDR